eukprot:gene3009-13030_t
MSWVPGPCVYESLLRALVSDGLARELAGKHMYAVARTRILDDLLRKEIGAMVKKEGADIQVVAVGCGMDTRPWRLRGNGFNITCMELKAKGLQRGGAEQSRAKDGKQKRLEAANALVVDGYHAVSCNVVAGGDLKSSLIKADFGPGSVGHSGWSAFKDETGEMSDYLRSTYRAESFPAYHWTVNSDLGRLKDVEHIVTSSKK